MRQSLRYLPDRALVGVSLRSSQAELDRALRQSGVFCYSHDYVRDVHFERYVLSPSLRTTHDIDAFLLQLDADNDAIKSSLKWGCAKARCIRDWIGNKGEDNVLNDMDWALLGVAAARRRTCSCHEEFSFKTSSR